MTIEVSIADRWYEVPEPTGLAASSWDMLLSEITEGKFPIASLMRRSPDYVFYKLWEVDPDFERRLAGILRTYAPTVPWARGNPAELRVAFRKIVGYGAPAAGQGDVAWGGKREGYPG
ncbi:MAG: hypothetical protein V3U28_01025 [Candidatus Acidoferrales bacterium]